MSEYIGKNVNNSVLKNFDGHSIFLRRSAGSHIPVLIAIAKQIKIKNIIEIGTGIFSLKTFINQNIFPCVENIYSYETSCLWIDYIKEMVNDSRWHIKFVKGVEDLDEIRKINNIDLIFADGLYEYRIYAAKKLKDLSNIFILHDCDVDCIKNIATDEFKYNYIYYPPKYRPTAILSNSIDVSKINWCIEWDDGFEKWI